jgi:hypothetical protein
LDRSIEFFVPSVVPCPSSIRITHIGIEHLAPSLTDLEELVVSGLPLGAQGIDAIANGVWGEQLTCLDISHVERVTPEGFEGLGRLEGLRILRCCDLPDITLDSVVKTVSKMPRLRELWLSDCTWIDDDSATRGRLREAAASAKIRFDPPAKE